VPTEAPPRESTLQPIDVLPMNYDANRSPVGWYVGSYLLRFVEIEATTTANPRRRFHSWENTVLVKAKSFKQAYEKVARIGHSQTESYRGGREGVLVRWIYEGVTDLLPVYERLRDGAEIMWTRRNPRTVKALRRLVKSKRTFLRRAGAA
jgi:Domain of unknown function (DUF4288)